MPQREASPAKLTRWVSNQRHVDGQRIAGGSFKGKAIASNLDSNQQPLVNGPLGSERITVTGPHNGARCAGSPVRRHAPASSAGRSPEIACPLPAANVRLTDDGDHSVRSGFRALFIRRRRGHRFAGGGRPRRRQRPRQIGTKASYEPERGYQHRRQGQHQDHSFHHKILFTRGAQRVAPPRVPKQPLEGNFLSMSIRCEDFGETVPKIRICR